MRVIIPLTLVLACAPATTTSTAPSPGYGERSSESNCEQLCVHVLGCQGGGEDRLQECHTECFARGVTPDQVSVVLAMSCEQINAAQAGESGPAGESGQGGATACTADCHGCVGDGTSCYHGTGFACDACCCAPGGPSPVWR